MALCFRQLTLNGTITEVGMKTLFETGGKTFLTPAVDQDSSVSWNVCVDSYDRAKDIDIGSMLKIRDCHKLVSLEFFIGDRDTLEQRLGKLDTLISELNKFRAALIQGHHYKKEAKQWLKRS